MTTLLVTSIAPLVFYGRKRWKPWKMFAALMRRSIACFLNSNKKMKNNKHLKCYIFQSCLVSFTHSFPRDLILSKIYSSPIKGPLPFFSDFHVILCKTALAAFPKESFVFFNFLSICFPSLICTSQKPSSSESLEILDWELRKRSAS